jgi:zinc protease
VNRLLVALGLGLALGACGPDVNAYRARPPAKPVATQAPDPEAWREQRPSAGERVEVRFPMPELEKLKNGLTVYVVRRPAAAATLRLVVRHGASSLPAGKSGLASLTTRLMIESTKSHDSLALAEAAESLGAPLAADAGRDDAFVGLSALTEDMDRALSLLAEVTTSPAFETKEFERVRSEWVDGLVAERQSPDRLASLAGLRLLFGPAHGAPVGGAVSDVKKLSVADLKAFHARAFRPESAALIIVGDVGLDGVRASVERHFGRWKGKPGATSVTNVPVPPLAPRGKTVTIVDRPGAVQTALFAAQRFPARSAPGHEAREVMSSLLGGLFTSRINMNLREKNAFTYGASGRAVATRSFGAFVVSSSVRTDVTAPALREVIRELERARDPGQGAPITPEEIGRAKADLLHGLGARLEHTSRVAAAVVPLFSLDLGADYLTRYPSLLDLVSPSEVASSTLLLTPDDLVVVVVGDQKQIGPALEQQGYKLESAATALVD